MRTSYNFFRSHRVWLFRIAAIGLGLLPFILIEATLRFLDVPGTPAALDPFVDLHHLKPLFELDSDAQKYRIGGQRLNLFRPAQFAAKKKEGSYRVFCLGGSTTQGEPYSTETAFGQWLQLNLQLANSQREIEVINCGGLSYASYRVRAVLLEVLQYSPDLVVVYTGQNEFLEKRTYENWRSVSAAYAGIRHELTNLHSVQLVKHWLGKDKDAHLRSRHTTVLNRTEMSEEVEALLDYHGGLEDYHRDDPWREPIVAHFRWNLQRMVEDCQSAAVPLILMRPVVNLLDCPPFKFEPPTHLQGDQAQRMAAAWQAAQKSGSDLPSVKQALTEVLSIDPHHAAAWYYLGRIQWEQRDWQSAKHSLQKAVDTDVCPLRALSSIQQVVADVAREYSVPMVDAEQLFSQASEHGVVGNRWLVDHVHPTVEGHQVLGEALSEVCIQQSGFNVTNTNWRDGRSQAYSQHLSQLGEAYFHRGRQRLAGLQLWTQGRAKKIREK